MKLTEKIAVASVASVLLKFLLSGITIKYGATSMDFGGIDALVIAAILTPTIGAPHLETFVKGKAVAQVKSDE